MQVLPIQILLYLPLTLTAKIRFNLAVLDRQTTFNLAAPCTEYRCTSHSISLYLLLLLTVSSLHLSVIQSRCITHSISLHASICHSISLHRSAIQPRCIDLPFNLAASICHSISLYLSARLLQLALPELPATVRFNLTWYGSSFNRLWTQPRAASETGTLQQALAALQNLRPNMGRTELWRALQVSE